MRKFTYYSLLVFIIAGVMWGGIPGFKGFDFVFKPLIMVWMAAFFLDHSRGFDTKLRIRILAAFIFSWFGDILLMYSGLDFMYFILGLVAFLISQVFYIFSFNRSVNLTGKNGYLKGRQWLLLPFLIYGLTVYLFLFSYMNSILQLAVPLYILAIISMSIAALNRAGTVDTESFRLVFIGSLFFIVSDSLLAVNKFAVPIPFERIFVMGSYISAQYLIMRGLVRQFRP